MVQLEPSNSAVVAGSLAWAAKEFRVHKTCPVGASCLPRHRRFTRVVATLDDACVYENVSSFGASSCTEKPSRSL